MHTERRRRASERIDHEDALGLRRRRITREEQPDYGSDRDNEKKLSTKPAHVRRQAIKAQLYAKLRIPARFTATAPLKPRPARRATPPRRRDPYEWKHQAANSRLTSRGAWHNATPPG